MEDGDGLLELIMRKYWTDSALMKMMTPKAAEIIGAINLLTQQAAGIIGALIAEQAAEIIGLTLNLLMALLAAGVVSTLLLIGGVESNPGPYPCQLCQVVPETISSSLRHQYSHAKNSSFTYQCPVPGCHFWSTSYGTMNGHVSLLHKDQRHVDPDASVKLSCKNLFGGSECPTKFETTSLWLLVQHLYLHLKDGIKVTCPFECDHSFGTRKAMAVHLSIYHKGWREEGCPQKSRQQDIPESEENIEENIEENVFNACNFEGNGNPMLNSDLEVDVMNDELLVDSIGKFYLFLYAEKALADTTIQEICDSISYMTKTTHARMRKVLSEELQQSGITENRIKQISHRVFQADRLYTSHNKSSLVGPFFTSYYRRKKFFCLRFNMIEPIEKNLNPKNPESKDKLQYIPIKSTLAVALQDPVVAKEVQQSFMRQHKDDGVIRDYTDGSQFRSENHPKKEIQVFLYQDGLNPVINVLGSAKNQYKSVVFYYTIGSIDPHLRAKINSKHLVLMIRESLFKKYDREIVLEDVMSDLKSLERDGIEFMGEKVNVVVQFMLGDSLGQHQIGGYIESFSTNYMCRHCDITAQEFKADPSTTNPQRTIEDYNYCVLRSTFSEKPFKGIKSSCVLNDLRYFHATSHLPPCSAHDVLEGVLSWDLAGIISTFVKKKWFTYSLINKRIHNFKYQGIDQRNKPAKLRRKKPKLGGHAVQNWTLMRLLYLLIGDKIQDFEDPAWQLYLKLKEICEIEFAPSFEVIDVSYLKDVLIPSYFDLRSKVLTQAKYRLKPKHHFWAHSPEHLLRYGPLLYVWTLTFEQKHKYMKEVMRNTKNFINPEKTCAERNQMAFCYRSLETLFDNVFMEFDSKNLSADNYSGDLARFISEQNLHGWLDSKTVIANYGITYKKGDVLLLSNEEDFISVGKVNVILSREEELQFILTVRKAAKNLNTGLYEVNFKSSAALTMISGYALSYPVPHPMYLKGSKMLFSLKHKILKTQCEGMDSDSVSENSFS